MLCSAPRRANLLSAETVKRAEYYWGYGAGIAVTKVPVWGGFILAELTQPFDQGGLTYCFPWMQRVDARLGFRPCLAALDTAFDVRYVDAHSHRENENPRSALRPYYSLRRAASNGRGTFAPDGRPRRAVRLSMPLQFTYADRTTCLVEQERGKYACPLALLDDRCTHLPSSSPKL
jgi:hypothetical protein